MPLLVRMSDEKAAQALTFIEAGATGILLAGTRTAEQIASIVNRIKYSPMGDRGIALQALHNGYEAVKVTEYMKRANEETMVVAHIESREGFENLEEILSVPGVDGMTIGAMDYSDDLGDPGNLKHPQIRESMKHAVVTAKKTGRFCGIITSNAALGEECIHMGMKLWVCGTDAGILMEGARRGVANFKKFVAAVE